MHTFREKKRLFARYDMEKETIIQLLSNGVEMRDIIGIYNDSMPQKAACLGGRKNE